MLLNLVDNIYHNTDSDRRKGWNLLVRILNTLINKFESLRHDIPLICNAELKRDNDAVQHAMTFHEKLISIAADKRKIEQAERLKLQEQLKLSVRSEAVVPVVEKKNEMEGVNGH